MLATDLADYLVRRGVPFRDAHHLVGQVVQQAAEEGVSLAELPLTTLQTISPKFSGDVVNVFDFQAAVERKNTKGGTAPQAVRDQIQAAKDYLDANAG
jgi:argininosuccinate lyase